MSAGVYDISIERGSDFLLAITVNSGSGVLDLTNFTVESDIREYQNWPPVASFAVEVVNATGGMFSISMGGAESLVLPHNNFLYDVLAISPANERTRLLEGSVLVDPNITDGS